MRVEGWPGFCPQPDPLLSPLELQGPPPTEKEALLRRLVALLEEEAEVINQKVMVGVHPLARIGVAL